MTTRRTRFAAVTAGAVALAFPALADVALPSVTAGSNYDIDFNEELEVPFSGFAGAWFLSARLTHAPDAGPMIKRFESPITDTLDPILLDAQQPFALPVRETFHLFEPPVLDPNLAPIDPFSPVYGWYEEILTDGWVWAHQALPILDDSIDFPLNPPLVTKNGLPHPWRFGIQPAGSLGPDGPDDTRPLVFRPDILNIEFSRIDAGERLGINKSLLWVGTEGNRIWGDDQLDDGTPFREDEIRVWEHPWDLESVFGFDRELVGDHDRSGRVGQRDLDLVLQNWGQDAETEGLPRHWIGLPAQGLIDQDELDAVLQNWGNSVFDFPPGPVPLPEPGAVAFVALAGASLWPLRRRA